MDGFVVHEVTVDLVVRIGRAMPELPPAMDLEVERLWQAAGRRVVAGGGEPMFNGRVFSADTITPRLITGHLTEYRRVVAQMECPGLFAMPGSSNGMGLVVRPLAVCGVLRCADGVVVGRRQSAAIYQAGMWQLPPAGSVDAGAMKDDGMADLRRQLLNELHEELGLGPDTVGEMRPLCIVEHPGSRVSDLGLGLTTDLTGEMVLAAHRSGGNGEYQELRIVSEDRLAGFLAEAGESLVTPAREFLIGAGLTNRRADSVF